MHFPSLFLFNAVVLNVLHCITFAILAYQFWRDLRQTQSRVTRAIAIFFCSLALVTGWSAVYTSAVLFGLDNYPATVVILLVRDIFLTALLASTIYLVMELRYGNNH